MAENVNLWMTIDGKFFKSQEEAEQHELTLKTEIQNNIERIKTLPVITKLLSVYSLDKDGVWELSNTKLIESNSYLFKGKLSALIIYLACFYNELSTYNNIGEIKYINDLIDLSNYEKFDPSK